MDYEIVPVSANLPLMRMNSLLLTYNQLQEIVVLLLWPSHVMILFWSGQDSNPGHSAPDPDTLTTRPNVFLIFKGHHRVFLIERS